MAAAGVTASMRSGHRKPDLPLCDDERVKAASRIWDTFMLRDELDMLELRLRTLDGQVYRHVISESPVTHQGEPKPLHFMENLKRFSPWLDRITYVSVDPAELPEGADPPCLSPGPVLNMCPKAWEREYAQRNWLRKGMAGIEPGDIVLHGDVDEIPRLDGFRPSRRPRVFAQRNHIFAVDWLHPDPWPGTIAAPWRKVKSFQDLRALRGRLPQIPGGGWHFSWLGGLEGISRKNQSIAHGELAFRVDEANEVGRLYEQGWCPWDDVQMEAVTVDEAWPEWITSRECPRSWFRPQGAA